LFSLLVRVRGAKKELDMPCCCWLVQLVAAAAADAEMQLLRIDGCREWKEGVELQTMEEQQENNMWSV
jgi:hypothetical protein